jgi:hypothetical protein
MGRRNWDAAGNPAPGRSGEAGRLQGSQRRRQQQQHQGCAPAVGSVAVQGACWPRAGPVRRLARLGKARLGPRQGRLARGVGVLAAAPHHRPVLGVHGSPLLRRRARGKVCANALQVPRWRCWGWACCALPCTPRPKPKRAPTCSNRSSATAPAVPPPPSGSTGVARSTGRLAAALDAAGGMVAAAGGRTGGGGGGVTEIKLHAALMPGLGAGAKRAVALNNKYANAQYELFSRSRTASASAVRSRPPPPLTGERRSNERHPSRHQATAAAARPVRRARLAVGAVRSQGTRAVAHTPTQNT